MIQQVIVKGEGGTHTWKIASICIDFHADDLVTSGDARRLDQLGPGLPAPGPLQRRRPDTDRLIAAVKAAGGTKVQGVHVATDHGWSDRRLTLQALVINWLAGL